MSVVDYDMSFGVSGVHVVLSSTASQTVVQEISVSSDEAIVDIVSNVTVPI